MGNRFVALTVLVLVAPLCWGQDSRISRDPNSTTVIGPRNVPLYDGAQELLAGNDAEGVRLTHKGLQLALGGARRGSGTVESLRRIYQAGSL